VQSGKGQLRSISQWDAWTVGATRVTAFPPFTWLPLAPPSADLVVIRSRTGRSDPCSYRIVLPFLTMAMKNRTKMARVIPGVMTSVYGSPTPSASPKYSKTI